MVCLSAAIPCLKSTLAVVGECQLHVEEQKEKQAEHSFWFLLSNAVREEVCFLL